MTATAQKCQSYDRSVELEQIGGRFFSLAKGKVRDLVAGVAELEQHDHDLHGFSGKDLSDCVDPIDDARILPIFAHLIGMIKGLWGVSITVVLFHMGMETEAERFEVLLDLCLGCEGHGVSLADSYSAELSKAENALGKALPPCPIFYDYDRFSALASEVYHERYSEGVSIAA